MEQHQPTPLEPEPNCIPLGQEIVTIDFEVE